MTKCKKRLLAAVILITAAFFLAPNVLASELVDTTVNEAYGFSRYPIGHYALDLYIDPSAGGGFLGIQLPDVSRILFSITNAIWELCVFLASAVGSVVQEAFRLDFLSRATDEIGRNIQQIAGVSERGFSSTGFLPMLLPLAVLATGAYVLYVGLFKREMTKALGAVVNFLVMFVLIIGFIAFAPSYIQAINSLSVDLADGALRTTNAILNPGANDTDVAVAGIREALHQVQIHAPWQLLQYGSLDIDPARVHELLSHAPHSDARLDVVVREVEGYSNLHIGGEVDRFGTVLILFFVNLGISIFVLSLTGLMIFSQLLLIFYLTLLPVALVLSLFPTFSGIAKRCIERVFNTLLLRVGYTLIITIAFSLSLLVYRVSAELSMPFLLVGLLQILVFWGVHRKQDELLGILSLQSNENHRAERSVLRSGRNLGRKALAFGKGIITGKLISRHRSQQGANVPVPGGSSGAGTQSGGANTAGSTGRPRGSAETPQNVDAQPGKSGKSDKPEQPHSVARNSSDGRIGRSGGKEERARDRPDHARRSEAKNVSEFPEERGNQQTQVRDNVEMKRTFEKPKPQDSEHMPLQQEAPRPNVAPGPRYTPAKNTATYKLNGEPVTRDQLERWGEPPQTRRNKRKRGDTP